MSQGTKRAAGTVGRVSVISMPSARHKLQIIENLDEPEQGKTCIAHLCKAPFSSLKTERDGRIPALTMNVALSSIIKIT